MTTSFTSPPSGKGTTHGGVGPWVKWQKISQVLGRCLVYFGKMPKIRNPLSTRKYSLFLYQKSHSFAALRLSISDTSTTLCVNTVRAHFPWSILHILLSTLTTNQLPLVGREGMEEKISKENGEGTKETFPRAPLFLLLFFADVRGIICFCGELVHLIKTCLNGKRLTEDITHMETPSNLPVDKSCPKWNA